MTRNKLIGLLVAVTCSILLSVGPVLAEPNGPTDPNKGVRSVTTPLNGGNATAGAIADPNGGIGAQIGTGNSRRTPGTQQPGLDPFAQLVARLAQQACSAGRDTIIFEMPVGASNGFTCVAPNGSSTPDSLAGFALAAESSIPSRGLQSAQTRMTRRRWPCRRTTGSAATTEARGPWGSAPRSRKVRGVRPRSKPTRMGRGRRPGRIASRTWSRTEWWSRRAQRPIRGILATTRRTRLRTASSPW